MPTLEQVFGVSAKPLLSYVERHDVDSRLREAIASDKQVVVYGSSKQGKTALVTRHLPYEQHIHVSLTPKMNLRDVYRIVLACEKIELVRSTVRKSGSEASLSVGTKLRAKLPMLGGAAASVASGVKGRSGTDTHYEPVPINLEIPQNIASLLAEVHSKKWIILENFHYLNDKYQKQFAFDLRSFQELGVRFVILGVWREKNRMAQFNGDLLDRVVEIPVEPWTSHDFGRVAKRGSEQLGIMIGSEFVYAASRASFGSIAVFQELIKESCKQAGIHDDSGAAVILRDEVYLQQAIATKADDYGARHRRALTDIAAGRYRRKDDAQSPLHLWYYLVVAVLQEGYEGIVNGLSRSSLQSTIRAIHPRRNEVLPADLNALFHGLARLQAVKSISPPILHYDHQNRVLQVVDSTFHFFIKHVDGRDIIDSIPSPRESGS